MRNLVNIIALLLILAWSIGYIGYGYGGIIHIFLITGIAAIILRVFLDRKSFKSTN